MTDTHISNPGDLFELAGELTRKAAEQENEDALNVLLSLAILLPVLEGEIDVATALFDKQFEKFEEMLRASNVPELEARETMQIFTENTLKALMILVASACADDQVQEQLAAAFRTSLEEAEAELSKS